MRISIVLIGLLVNLAYAAPEDTNIKKLFEKYEQVFDDHKTELVEEVFTKKFLEGNGGKEEFIKKVKSEPKSKEKSNLAKNMTWKKGVIDRIWFGRFKNDKKSKEPASSSEFIIVEENGKFKIDGTLSDG